MKELNQKIKPAFILTFSENSMKIKHALRKNIEFELSGKNLFALLGDGLIANLVPVDTVDDDGVWIGEKIKKFLTLESFNSLKLPTKLHLNEEIGHKLCLLFCLSEGIEGLRRAELIARRLERFTREEAAYWYSWTTRFHKDVSEFAIRGFRTMLCGEGKAGDDEKVEEILRRY